MITVLLEDPLFKDNMEIILDESLTIFVAGTQTQAIQISNTFCYLAKNPAIYQKARAEIEEKIVQPYLKENNLEKLKFNQILDILTIDNSSQL